MSHKRAHIYWFRPGKPCWITISGSLFRRDDSRVKHSAGTSSCILTHARRRLDGGSASSRANDIVVSWPTTTTANQIHNNHLTDRSTPGNGPLRPDSEGGPRNARARSGTVDIRAGIGSTHNEDPGAVPDAPDEDVSETDRRLRVVLGEGCKDTARAGTCNRTGGATGRKKGRKKKRREERRAALQIASLNINGYGNLIRDHPDNKWGKLYRLMNDHRIGILLLQETHLTEERVAAIHQMFAKKIRVFYSANPEAPTQREGVALVLNARYVDTTHTKATTIVPGKALQVTVSCQGGDAKHLLCVYAPTSSGIPERRRFYEEVRQYYENNPTCSKPHLMAGDFNNVEDTIDRLPVNEGPDQSVTALDELKISLGLQMADGWRITNPNTREYTFHRGTGKQAVFSRLDRIYVTPEVFDNAREWTICEAGVRTDHSLIKVQITPKNAPIVGQGRPLFPLSLIKDKTLAKAIKERGLKAIRELANLNDGGHPRSERANPQLILRRFKEDTMQLARDREKEIIPKLLAEIRNHERALKQVKGNRDIQEDVKVAEAAALTRQIRELKQQRYRQQQQNSRATHRLYGDRPTKYWSKLHRECAPRDVIAAFEKEGMTGTAGEKLYETDSVRMAAMARTHHMTVQRDDADIKPRDEREGDIVLALNRLDVEVTGEQAQQLGEALTYDEVVLSLRFAKNGSSPGLDGIPFELWKTLRARHVEDSRFPERTTFDVIALLLAAFEDARTYGVDAKAHFAQGWIAPIYKEKGERTRVVNYRPITLLNTDYKLLSKSLAVRLADVAPRIINKAQAGFVPGRKIHNHTQLARLMIHWAERNEKDGAIVALDQEKAYDRIAHDYLWRVLEKFGIPGSFICLVKSLYQHAETSVMVNGILSKTYRVYRGVRQGDPLSCLLFDLAIEPLSAMIRSSEIEGFNIPRCDEILKAVLFADDTTVYLSSHDDFGTLQAILDTWCSAAKARFNIGKTEIIPIGRPEYRQEMAETYLRTGAWKNYPRGVHVAQEGEAVRILGAFFGNGLNQVAVWTLVLNKIVAMRKPLAQVIARWKEGHASTQGKKHVIQMIIGGMTQYLTSVQRMPEEILKRLNKIVRGYLWDDRHNTPVGRKHVCLPVERGGLGMLDLETRNEAIDMAWLKAYLDFSEDRPLWAYIADDIYASHVPKDCRPKQKELRINPFLQRWQPKVRGLPDELRSMMSIAKKYGLRVEGLAFSRRILNAMPMWDHLYADRTRLGRLTMPSKLLTCLQHSHKVMTVGDFLQLANTLQDPAHTPKATCKCADCTRMRSDVGCSAPHLCAMRATAMISTLPSKWNPTARQPEDYERRTMEDLCRRNEDEGLTAFDRSVTTHGNLGHVFRVFTGPTPVSNEGAPMELDERQGAIIVATDGSCTSNGEKNARAGAGVFVEGNPRLNRSVRLPETLEQSNQTGEIVGTIIAATVVDSHQRIILETDSQTTMNSLTKWRQRHEDTGYILQKNTDLTRTAIASYRMRKAHTLFRWVKGHNGHPRNDAADGLAVAGAAMEDADQLNLGVPARFNVTGAKLQAISQGLAYRAMSSRKNVSVLPRPRATANLDRISCGIHAAYGTEIHDSAIWKSLRTRHVSRQATQFMWMAIHDGYMIGNHWLRPKMSAELQERATCSICGECETMSHVVLNCDAIGQRTVWRLLRQTWQLTGKQWHDPNWGTTFGAACAVFRTDKGTRLPATEQLWCILCTEALHLIWKLRCERVIQRGGEEFTENEVTNRYYSTMDSRLSLDRRTAAMAKGKRSLKPQDVERIWRPVLENADNLPPKWVTNSGVLVGIKRGR